jgi:protein-S-isoprenylcysteine O-methyltransferase Ste14
MKQTLKRLINRGCSSLRNHIVLIFIAFSLPMMAMSSISSYQDGELTPLWMLRIIGVCTVAGVIAAIIGWFIILPPLLRRSKPKNSDRR